MWPHSLCIGDVIVHETKWIGTGEDGCHAELADVLDAQLVGVVDQLAAGDLVYVEDHLPGGELEHGAHKGGRDVHTHDALLQHVLADDGVAQQALVDLHGAAKTTNKQNNQQQTK